jgi:hypothetical protein
VPESLSLCSVVAGSAKIDHFQIRTLPKNAKIVLSELKDNQTGKIYGRAALRPGISYRKPSAVITVGGFRPDELEHFEEIFLGETETAARNMAIPTAPAHVLQDWVREQAKILARSEVLNRFNLLGASIVMLLGGDATQIEYDQDKDNVHPRDFEKDLRMSEEVFIWLICHEPVKQHLRGP